MDERFLERLTTLIEACQSFVYDNAFCSNGTAISLSDFTDLTAKDLTTVSRPMPKFLFRFKPDIKEDGTNYSREELRTGKIHLSTPDGFNDPFDCNPGMGNIFINSLVGYYIAALCGRPECPICPKTNGASMAELADLLTNVIAKHEQYVKGLMSKKPTYGEKPLVDFTKDLLQDSSASLSVSEIDVERAVRKAQIKSIFVFQQSIEVACFSTELYSNYMWAHYANEYKGFCIAYPTDDACNGGSCPDISALHDLPIFPVFYSLRRLDVSDYLARLSLGKVSPDAPNPVMQTLLLKGIEWFQEKEWRLLLPSNSQLMIGGCICAPKPAFVFAGPKMADEEFKSLQDICKDRNIPLLRTQLSNDQFTVVPCG